MLVTLSGDRDASQVSAVEERVGPNANDRQAIDGTGDRFSSARSRVAGDGDRTVVGLVGEFGSHRIRQRQKQQER